MDKRQITVSATVRLPLGRVWELFTDPGHITGWYFASDDWYAPAAENDLRVGGKLKIRMASRDGNMGFDFEGIYTKVEERRSLCYTLGDDRKVEITFSEEDGLTRVTETFDAENIHSEEQQRAGWEAILLNFKKYAEASE